ncbi:hypothetical protein EDI_137570 [Entamoeba dispar SAW760]|uniref:Uncharacterized protein n=1 Tax=Entamoeba dispar (strain ATCC PRA-260 / SAW760) TaxID=370354 RepID=B0EAB2_ENTDS|nr:uncharacterized protein EDI_137570 [Entamoeba dispar SAW760]EDR28538.1 hypothetical protein EDI_137570 [Entamoeba dispar SAW760]|eukprot:EDR28538.1 hypothetical protein EDI_137570 [Entamoeba dispar SAW760]
MSIIKKSTKSISESTDKKRKSVSNEIKEKSFIIGCVIRCGISLELERKTKNDEGLQNFNIISVCDERVQEEINKRFKEWENFIQEKKGKVEQRDKDKSYQNINYETLLEELSNYGNQINYKKTRGSSKTVKRKRISTFNGIRQEEIYEIGEKVNKYLIKEIRIEEGKKKKECRQVINEIDPNIIITPLFSNFKVYCSESNYDNENFNQIEQIPDCYLSNIVQIPDYYLSNIVQIPDYYHNVSSVNVLPNNCCTEGMFLLNPQVPSLFEQTGCPNIDESNLKSQSM